MTDRRHEILNTFNQPKGEHADCFFRNDAVGAMDEYMEETCLELLDYVAKHVQNTIITDAGVSMFLVDNNWIEKEELFKNFL